MKDRHRLPEESGTMAGTIALRCEVHAVFKARSKSTLAVVTIAPTIA
jgi:hypothetical protein